jgi:hypothetical protein
MSWISIDVDLDDVYREMDRRDKEKMARWLDDDGYFEEPEGRDIPPSTSSLENQFHDMLINL